MVRLQLNRKQLLREKQTKRLRPHQRNKRKTEKVVKFYTYQNVMHSKLIPEIGELVSQNYSLQYIPLIVARGT